MRTKHIKYYTKAKALLKAHFEKEIREAKLHLKKAESTWGNKDCWDERSQCYRYPAPNCCLCTEDDIKRSRHYLEKIIPLEQKKWEDRLEAADKAGKLIELRIDVNWGRDSEYRCLSPRAEVWLSREDPKYGSVMTYHRGDVAGGAGYDKASAAVSDALTFEVKKRDSNNTKECKIQALASLDRFIIEHGEELWKEYGIAKKPFPHLHFNAAGMSCFTRLFKRIGSNYNDVPAKDYLIDFNESEKGTDTYHVIRKDRI